MIDTRQIIEELEAATVLGERLLQHAKWEGSDTVDRLNQREQVAHIAGMLALIAWAMSRLELEEDHEQPA